MPTAFQNWLIANNKPGVADMTPGMYSTYSNQFQNQDKAELPTIDTSNPQVMTAGFSWPFGGTNEYATTRPSGIDTLMNYQDPIRSLPGGNYQNWQDSIMNQKMLDLRDYEDSLRDINTNPRWDDEGIYTRQKGEPWFAENRKNPIKNLFNKDTNIFGYQRGPNDFNFPSVVGGIMNALGGTRTPENQAAYEAITASQGDKGWGTYEGNPYQIRDGKIYSDLDPYGSHADSLFGSKSIEARDQKKIDWALGRLDKFKDDEDNLGISKRLFNVLVNRGVIDESGKRVITPSGVDEVIDRTTSRWQPDAGTGSTYTGPQTYDYSPSQAARTEHYTERPGTRGGYIDPGKGSYGPWKAEGGRIGYANGEFVDEDVNIQGPGFDVNENIEMASAPNPLAELEAFSLEIFKKSFDQLNDNERDILFDMLNDQAMNEQGEGIASLV